MFTCLKHQKFCGNSYIHMCLKGFCIFTMSLKIDATFYFLCLYTPPDPKKVTPSNISSNQLLNMETILLTLMMGTAWWTFMFNMKKINPLMEKPGHSLYSRSQPRRGQLKQSHIITLPSQACIVDDGWISSLASLPTLMTPPLWNIMNLDSSNHQPFSRATESGGNLLLRLWIWWFKK